MPSGAQQEDRNRPPPPPEWPPPGSGDRIDVGIRGSRPTPAPTPAGLHGTVPDGVSVISGKVDRDGHSRAALAPDATTAAALPGVGAQRDRPADRLGAGTGRSGLSPSADVGPALRAATVRRRRHGHPVPAVSQGNSIPAVAGNTNSQGDGKSTDPTHKPSSTHRFGLRSVVTNRTSISPTGPTRGQNDPDPPPEDVSPAPGPRPRHLLPKLHTAPTLLPSVHHRA